MEQILVKEKNLAIGINSSDLLRGIFNPYLIANYVQYEVENFKPFEGGQKAHEKYVNWYNQYLPQAKAVFEAERKELAEAFGTVEESVKHPLYNVLLNIYKDKENVLIIGEAGTGKSYLVAQVAKALGCPFHQQGSVQEAFELLGFVDAQGRYNETEFYRAYKEGGIFLLDEMDACSEVALLSINNALTNDTIVFPNGEVVKRGENFVVFGTANTYGTGATLEYCGRTKLDDATLNRFATEYADYCEEIELAKAFGNHALVDFIHAYRKAYRKLGVKTLATYRDISRIAKREQWDNNLPHNLKSSMVKGMEADNVKSLANYIRADMGADAYNLNKYAQALYNLAEEVCK